MKSAWPAWSARSASVGQADAPGHDHRNVGELLDGLREPEREPLVPARILDVAAPLPRGDRQVVDRRHLLQDVDDLERVLEGQTSRGVLVGAEPGSEHEVGATAGAHLLDDLDEESGAPLGRASPIGIAAPVRRGREELRHEVAVCGVHLGAVNPGRGVVGGRPPEGLDDLADIGLGHLPRDGRAPGRRDRRRRERDRLRLAAGGLAAEVDQLADHRRAVPVHGLGPHPE